MYRKLTTGLLRPAAFLLAVLLMLSAQPARAEDVEDENLFNKKDPFFAQGYNFVQSTGQITGEPDSFITGYIEVEPGDVVSLNLNSTKDSDFIKYALYDEEKNWKDTVKINNVSELTVRIFEKGLIRFSVFGRAFEESITIYISSGRTAADSMDQDTVVVTPNNTNIIVKTTEDDTSEYWIDRFDRSDPDYLDKSNFIGLSNLIVEEGTSFITGFIEVKRGDTAILSLNGNIPSSFIKYAIYDTDKEWRATFRDNNVSESVVTITEDGFIRFSVNGRLFKNTATVYVHPATNLAADQTIDEIIMPAIAASTGRQESFDQNYLSEEVIDLFNPNDPEFLLNQGYRQLTDEIVDNEGSFLTGYIPVIKGQVVVVSITEPSEFAKYALFNQERQWLSTTRVDNPTVLVVPIEETGYFRLHGYGKAINGTVITIPSVRKLDINAISGNIASRLERLETEANIRNEVDVMIFVGQSNMAGRGEVTEEHPEDAPAVIEGAGWEFRAVTDPTSLHPIDKYFGLNENAENGINDGDRKTGGLVPAFVNAYYTNNGRVPVVGVSASEGFTSLNKWLPGTDRLNDVIGRLNTCVTWLKENGYEIRHRYMVWCQGESDDMQTAEWYTERFDSMLGALREAGIEKCFMIRVGNNESATLERVEMMRCQNAICRDNDDVVMVSLDFAGMLGRGLVRDVEHYYQEAYNICGTHAGINAAYYVTTGKEPVIYDPEFRELYYSTVN